MRENVRNGHQVFLFTGSLDSMPCSSLAYLTLRLFPDERCRTTLTLQQVGMTPLMLGCRLGHESLVDMLVSVFGAEIDPADKVGPRQQPQNQSRNNLHIFQRFFLRPPLRRFPALFGPPRPDLPHRALTLQQLCRKSC